MFLLENRSAMKFTTPLYIDDLATWIFFVWLVIPDPYFWNTGLQQTTRSPNIAEMTQRSLRMVRKKN